MPPNLEVKPNIEPSLRLWNVLSIDAVITKRYGNEKRSHSLSYMTKINKILEWRGGHGPPLDPPLSAALLLNDGVVISIRQIKWILQRLNLHQRWLLGSTSSTVVHHRSVACIRTASWYRWMFEKCKANGLVVKKEDIQILLATLDPEGSNITLSRRIKRRLYFTKGPNFLWHIDSYDKLNHSAFASTDVLMIFFMKFSIEYYVTIFA